MALRSMWTGTLQIGDPVTGFEVPVSAVKAVEDDENDEQLREVCSCHGRPLARPHLCAEHPVAQAIMRGDDAIEADEDGLVDLDGLRRASLPGGSFDVVKAAQTGADDYTIIDPGDLEQIKEVLDRETIPVLATQPYEYVATERFYDLYYLKPPSKARKADRKKFDALWAGLAGARVILAMWAPRGREYLVAIHAVGETILMSKMLYATEVREPEGDICERGDVNPRDAKAMAELLDFYSDPDFDYSEPHDRIVDEKARLIETVLEGEDLPEPVKAPAPAKGPVPALDALLAGALEQARKAAA